MPKQNTCRLIALVAGLLACGCHRQQEMRAQPARPADFRQSPSNDSAVYAAFFITLDNPLRGETLYVAERSAEVTGVSARHDSVVPGLGAALVRASVPTRASTELHLPPPFHVVADTTLTRMRKTDRETGLWQFSPIAYSKNGTDAMFYYVYTCGSLCGDASLVWASKDSDGAWRHRRTVRLVIF